VSVTVDGVGRELTAYLEARANQGGPAVIYRQYRSDDLTEPCYGPVRFVMKKVTVKGTDGRRYRAARRPGQSQVPVQGRDRWTNFRGW
jgi:hypothetical protein